MVYAVSDLDKAITEFEQLSGVRPIFGGYHSSFGTKNALINLTNGIYFELIANDSSNKKIPPPRWMGVDFLTKNQTTRWALKSNVLERDAYILKKYNPDMGKVRNGSRNTADGTLLQWELIMPLTAPEVEISPFMVDWSKTEKHPSEILPNMNCELQEFYAIHPNPEIFEELFKDLNFDLNIQKGSIPKIKVVLKTPNGIVTL
ncbi:MAG: VOC family protein [Maribacter sp.]